MTPDLIEQIGHAIRERTNGRLRDARITVTDETVTLHGFAPSFYLKQLALEGARSALGERPFRLQLEITVHVR